MTVRTVHFETDSHAEDVNHCGIARLRCCAIAAVFLFFSHASAAQKTDPTDNVAGPYVPTPWVIVSDMLKLADITQADVVYDLGSGDGRLVIAAAKRYGARGLGIELQPDLVDLARIEAKREGVEDRVRFRQADLFETDLKEATVVTLYLLPRFVTRLVPKLRAELRPGSRIVSHDYPLAPWPPDKVLTFDVEEKVAISGTERTNLYFYVVPARVGGDWELSLPRAFAKAPFRLRIRQEADAVEGVARAGSDTLPLRDLAVHGESVHFGLLYQGRLLTLQGTVTGDSMSGELVSAGKRERWSASHRPPNPR